jgi:hypothetical protein
LRRRYAAQSKGTIGDIITPVTQQITRLITAGTTEQALLAGVAQLFPNLSSAELSQALQVATTEAERKALRPH